MGEPLLQLLQAPTFTSDMERQRLWTTAFDRLRPDMAFAHVSLVLKDEPRLPRGRRSLLRDHGQGAALPLLDFDDFGEVLFVHIPFSTLPDYLPVVASLSPAPPDSRTLWQKQSGEVSGGGGAAPAVAGCAVVDVGGVGAAPGPRPHLGPTP